MGCKDSARGQIYRVFATGFSPRQLAVVNMEPASTATVTGTRQTDIPTRSKVSLPSKMATRHRFTVKDHETQQLRSKRQDSQPAPEKQQPAAPTSTNFAFSPPLKGSPENNNGKSVVLLRFAQHAQRRRQMLKKIYPFPPKTHRRCWQIGIPGQRPSQ